MENFDRENIDELLEICQIHQYFPVKILCRTVIHAFFHLASQTPKAITGFCIIT